MSGLDHSLIYDARKFINGANVHYVGTWILCYEISTPDSAVSQRYEALLRDFVATKKRMQAAKIRLERNAPLF
jgi:hypothetical protein